MPSTVELIKKEISSGPKEAVATVSKGVGGLLNAKCPGSVPRGEQQVSDYKRRRSNTPSTAMKCPGDDLYSVMLKAHLESSGEKFVRDIKAYPEPGVILASDQQLLDIGRFCTYQPNHCVLTIDPTFNLGAFDVTPMIYRHLLVECRRTGRPPVMIGPILIHYRKTFSTYLFFVSALVGLSKEIEKFLVEKALVDAMTQVFPCATHLTCFILVRRNIKDELTKLGIPDSIQKEVINDIFGMRTESSFYEGLVDAPNEDVFDRKLEGLQNKWLKHEDYRSSLETFSLWFLSHKARIMKETMIRPRREEAGLGSPPEAFYTNASECINSIIKKKVCYKSSDIPDLIAKLKELEDEQNREVEMAVIQHGKYSLRREYKFLEVTETKWFLMNREQRAKHLKKVGTTLVSTMDNNFSIIVSNFATHSTSVDNDICSLAPYINLPETALQAIYKKAIELVELDGAISPAPGQKSDARMVLSYTGKRPHLVTPKRTGGFACDDDCPQYSSCGVCSHVVATAVNCNKLDSLIDSLKKKKRNPNITKLATTTMPKGMGKKGGKAPSKRKHLSNVTTQRYELTPRSNLIVLL